MFSAFNEIFTFENMIFLGKGALLSMGIAAVSLLVGLVLGVLAYMGKSSKVRMFILKLFVGRQCYYKF